MQSTQVSRDPTFREIPGLHLKHAVTHRTDERSPRLARVRFVNLELNQAVDSLHGEDRERLFARRIDAEQVPVFHLHEEFRDAVQTSGRLRSVLAHLERFERARNLPKRHNQSPLLVALTVQPEAPVYQLMPQATCSARRALSASLTRGNTLATVHRQNGVRHEFLSRIRTHWRPGTRHDLHAVLSHFRVQTAGAVVV